MPKQPRLMAEPIMCILCRKTENLVGHLYHWNNGDLQPIWEGAPYSEVRYVPILEQARAAVRIHGM